MYKEVNSIGVMNLEMCHIELGMNNSASEGARHKAYKTARIYIYSA